MTALDYFFKPKNIAVIGASSKKGSIGYTIMENFVKSRLSKKVYPVNPFHKRVWGRKSHASVKDIAKDIDLAVIVVPAKVVPKVLRQCGEKGVEGVIIISAGFSEIGEKKLTAEVEETIRQYPKTRVIGPNCLGIFAPKHGMDTTFSVTGRQLKPEKGGLSFISQSGALGVVILDWAASQGFGFAKFISYGNAMDLDEADFLEYLSRDPDTNVITLYIEGAKEGRKFFEIAKKTSLRKPIVAIKGGTTSETAQATASHTGSLAGSAEVYKAVFEQTGIVRADNMMELFSFAKLFEKSALPKGNRTLIITNGGGFGIVTADMVVRNGLRLARLSGRNRKKLKKALPKTVSLHNPVDLIGDADAGRYELAIEAALNDSNVDMIAVVVLFNTPTIDERIIPILKRARKKSRKPIVVLSLGSDYTMDLVERIEKAGIASFSYPSVAARALKALHEYAEFRKNSG